MFMKLECGCGRVLKVPGELAGKKARCPNCMEVLDIPDELEPVEAGPEAPEPAPAPPQGPIAECAAMVEKFLKSVGLNPDEKRLRDRDVLGWWVKRGSAVVYIILGEKKGRPTIRVMSPIVYAPENNLAAYYRKCLEINLALVGCALGVVDNKTILLSERPIAGLDMEELQATLDLVSGVADELDDKLAKAYGCRLYGVEE